MLIKPADADRTLARPDPAVRVVLIHGSDEGLVSERAERFAATALGGNADALSRIRFDSAALADDPGRLADEAHAVPLFGGTRAILVRVAGNRPIDKAVAAILETPPTDAWVVIGAGELRKTSPLRKLCETHKRAWSIACYADSDRDLDRIIDEETAAADLRITDEARAALKALIGSDRLISRSEVKKLCLYAEGKSDIAIDDVRALIGDGAAFGVDEAIDAVAAGNTADLDRTYRRLVMSGTPGIVIAGAALRHFNFLEKARAAVDAGDSAESVVRRAIPPIFFSRQGAVSRQIATWSRDRIAGALSALDRAMLDSRLNGSLSDGVILQAMHTIAASGPPPSRRPQDRSRVA